MPGWIPRRLGKLNNWAVSALIYLINWFLGTLKSNHWYFIIAGGGLGGRKESGQLRFGGRDRPFKQPILLNGQQPKLIRSFDELKQYPENQECHIPSRDKRRWPSRERERSKSMEKKRSPSRNRKHSKRDDERSQSVRSERHKEKRRVRESSRRSRSVSVEKERRHKSKHKKRRR